jgi:hypothetical protein
VTTNGFFQLSGLESLRDQLDFDRLEEAGLLGKAPRPHELQSALGLANEAEAEAEDAEEADGTWPLRGISCKRSIGPPPYNGLSTPVFYNWLQGAYLRASETHDKSVNAIRETGK